MKSKIGVNNNLILPHSEKYDKLDTKEILKSCDVLVAEVSIPGIGIGLELGRAESNNIKIICVLKQGIKCNSSVKRNFTVVEYKDSSDMVEKLENIL